MAKFSKYTNEEALKLILNSRLKVQLLSKAIDTNETLRTRVAELLNAKYSTNSIYDRLVSEGWNMN